MWKASYAILLADKRLAWFLLVPSNPRYLPMVHVHARSKIDSAIYLLYDYSEPISLGFYCALPAEPHRTDMECNRIPRTS